MLGTVATFYSTDAVLMAVGTTAAVVFALTIFALQTKIDFTGCGGSFENITFQTKDCVVQGSAKSDNIQTKPPNWNENKSMM